MDLDLKGILKSVNGFRLPGGVVGKVSTTVIVVALALTAIALAVREIWIVAIVIIAIFVLAFTMLWRLINFADKNPQAALLEGAQFLTHQKMLLGTKAQPQLTVEPLDREEPLILGQESAGTQNVLEADASQEPSVLPPGGK